MAILHPIYSYPALLPRYVSRFSCIGSNCEDTCCAGWRVAVDKRTFNAYRQATHSELKTRFAQQLKRLRAKASDVEYARIELRPDTGECTFLEDRLCAIQRHIGEDNLSNTCFGYPRKTRNVGGQFEQSLVLSCPESARLALLAPDAFDFVTESIMVRADSVTTIRPRYGISLDLMNEIRIFCLQLIRTEGLELWQRLAVAGVFCQNLTETFADGGHAEVPSMVESFRAMVQNGQLADTLVDLKPDYPLQASFFGTLVLGRGIRDLSVFQGKVRQAIGAGLGISEEIGGLGAEQLVENYVRGVARLPDALQVAPRLLEHYLLNEMFSEMFPFKGASAYEHYRDIVSRFGLLRLMLAAQCNTNGSLPDAATLVQTVEVFCRLYQHDSAFSSMVNSIHKSSGSDKLERVFRFLRT